MRAKIIESLRARNIELVAVSKYVDASKIKELKSLGVRNFGENKVQALATKCQELEKEAINWHFIGNLQSNKINALLRLRPYLWQSCVSFEQAMMVDKRLDFELDTLLEVNFAKEASKQGCEPKIAREEYLKIKAKCKNIRLVGVMSIGARQENELKASFKSCYDLYESLKPEGAKICSMGMSSDYELAIACGSNMVRLGSVLFE